jgi:adenine phosphoribosyltransferase
MDQLKAAIRDIHDFPKEGIVFKDITPLLLQADVFNLAIRSLIATAGGQRVDKVVGIDARGFIFGAVVAYEMGVGFVPVRKIGKLPHDTESVSYALEYGEAEIEIHRDAILPGENVLIVDDLLATGGTAAAAIQLVKRLEGNLVGASFLIELTFLNGREVLGGDVPVYSLLTY